MQNEEYLDAADLSILRRSKRETISYAGYLDIDPSSGVTTLDKLCNATNINNALEDSCYNLLLSCTTNFGSTTIAYPIAIGTGVQCSFKNVISGADLTLSSTGFVAQCFQYSTDQYNIFCPTTTTAQAFETTTTTSNMFDM